MDARNQAGTLPLGDLINIIDITIKQLTEHEACLSYVLPCTDKTGACLGDAKKRKDEGEDSDLVCT